MGLVDRVRINLIRCGKLSLSELSFDHKFDENFVEDCIAAGGAEQFYHASDWLRSDAKFILKLIEKHPEVLAHCEDVIFDRYDDETGSMKEVELDKFFFIALCCEKNLRAYKFIPEKVAIEYMNAVKESKTITGEFNGKEKVIQLVNDEFNIDRLLNIRYDIIKLRDLGGHI